MAAHAADIAGLPEPLPSGECLQSAHLGHSAAKHRGLEIRELRTLVMPTRDLCSDGPNGKESDGRQGGFCNRIVRPFASRDNAERVIRQRPLQRERVRRFAREP